MSRRSTGLFCFLLFGAVWAFAAPVSSGRYCVTLNDTATSSWPPVFILHDGTAPACDSSVANGTYERSLLQTGWDHLEIQGNSSYRAPVIARAIGYLEGVLTADRANAWFYNVLSPNGSMAMPPQAEDYLRENMASMAAMVAKNDVTSDPYWVNVNLAWQQQLGLIDGITNGGSDLSATQIFALSSAGDLGDINNFVMPQRRHLQPTRFHPRDFAQWWMNNTHCSALVKVSDDLKNLYFGHATWANYNMMMRIFKSIRPNFPEGTPGVVANTVTYSSWPGALTSIDDFYVTDSGFGVMETSLSVFNFSIYSACKPTQILSFIRCAVANRMARNGSHWASVFSRYNSGTYNNQWIVVDWKLFSPGNDLPAGILTIVEQLPGIIRSGDFTSTLAYGYWPSYNIPYFKENFDLAGFPGAIAAQGGQMLDYETCVRARLFASYQNTVVDAPTMQNMLQYNQYQDDPLELGNPVYAIAARGDLTVGNPGFFGALDAKYTSFQDLTTNNTIYAFAGPTPQQGVFAWNNFSALAAATNIRGLPAEWNFQTQNYRPLQ